MQRYLDELLESKIILNDRIFYTETRKVIFEKFKKNDSFLVYFDLVSCPGFSSAELLKSLYL